MKTLGGSFKEWKRNVKIDTILEKSGGVYMRKRVNITVDAELWGQLQSLCARENWSCSGVIDACLRIVLGKEWSGRQRGEPADSASPKGR